MCRVGGELEKGGLCSEGEAGCCSRWMGEVAVAMETVHMHLPEDVQKGIHARKHTCGRVGEGRRGGGLVGGRRQVSVSIPKEGEDMCTQEAEHESIYRATSMVSHVTGWKIATRLRA